MALFYLIFAVIILPLFIFGTIGFIAGIVLLVVGLVSRKKPEHQSKRFPKVFIVVGSILVSIPVLAVVIAVSTGLVSSFRTYDSLPERWQNTWVSSENIASDQAIKALMNSAGEGDREALAKCFTAEIRKDSGFSEQIDDFFKKFPSELSKCELDGSSNGSSASYDHGHVEKTSGARYECELNGEKYYIKIEFCYENTDAPDKVGITYFSVRNLEAQALYLESVNRDPDNERSVVICDIRSSKEVNARLIDRIPYIWHPTSDEKLSEDEMRQLLSKTDSMDDLVSTIGEPNVSFKQYNSTGYDFIYELKPNGSEPQYAYIVAGSPTGEIYYAYLSSDEKTYYDNPLKSNDKS